VKDIAHHKYEMLYIRSRKRLYFAGKNGISDLGIDKGSSKDVINNLRSRYIFMKLEIRITKKNLKYC